MTFTEFSEPFKTVTYKNALVIGRSANASENDENKASGIVTS